MTKFSIRDVLLLMAIVGPLFGWRAHVQQLQLELAKTRETKMKRQVAELEEVNGYLRELLEFHKKELTEQRAKRRGVRVGGLLVPFDTSYANEIGD